jgi:hypothetical protein
MDTKFGFKVCRVCLRPDENEEFESLFEKSGKLAEIFTLISGGIKIDDEANLNEALICKICIKEVKRSFELMELIRKADRVYFARIRQQEIKTEPEIQEIVFEFDQENEQNFMMENILTVTTVNQEKAKSQVIEIINESEENREMEIENQQVEGESDPKMNFNPNHQTKKSSRNQQKKNDFICFFCNRSFHRKYHCKVHIEAIHMKIKNFSCDLCPKKFHQKANFNQHKKFHENPKSTTNVDNSRRFKCDIGNCLRSYNKKWNLDKHKKFVHTDEKRAQCHCGKSFKHKLSLRKHQKDVHE